MGRKRKPTALKVLAGNPGKRPLPENEPMPDAAIPMHPDHLDDEAIAEWDRITPLLYDLGLLTQIDRAALAKYCVAWSRWVNAERAMLKHGVIVKSPNGFPVQSPFLAVANRAMSQIKESLAEFGLSPSARTKVAATKKKEKANPFAELLG